MSADVNSTIFFYHALMIYTMMYGSRVSVNSTAQWCRDRWRKQPGISDVMPAPPFARNCNSIYHTAQEARGNVTQLYYPRDSFWINDVWIHFVSKTESLELWISWFHIFIFHYWLEEKHRLGSHSMMHNKCTDVKALEIPDVSSHYETPALHLWLSNV